MLIVMRKKMLKADERRWRWWFSDDGGGDGGGGGGGGSGGGGGGDDPVDVDGDNVTEDAVTLVRISMLMITTMMVLMLTELMMMTLSGNTYQQQLTGNQRYSHRPPRCVYSLFSYLCNRHFHQDLPPRPHTGCISAFICWAPHGAGVLGQELKYVIHGFVNFRLVYHH